MRLVIAQMLCASMCPSEMIEWAGCGSQFGIHKEDPHTASSRSCF